MSSSVFFGEGSCTFREVKRHTLQVRPGGDGTDLALFASSTWNPGAWLRRRGCEERVYDTKN